MKIPAKFVMLTTNQMPWYWFFYAQITMIFISDDFDFMNNVRLPKVPKFSEEKSTPGVNLSAWEPKTSHLASPVLVQISYNLRFSPCYFNQQQNLEYWYLSQSAIFFDTIYFWSIGNVLCFLHQIHIGLIVFKIKGCKTKFIYVTVLS